MSGLVLNVSADTAKLATMEDALNRLERLLKNPTSVNLTGLTSQVDKLEKDAVTAAASVAKLEKEMVDLASKSAKAAADTTKVNNAVKETAAEATKAEGSINLLTASYSKVAKASAGYAAEGVKVSTQLTKQGAATTELIGQMSALGIANRKQTAEEQARLAVVRAADKEFAIRVELLGAIAVANSELLPIMKAETLESAKLALSKKAITQARYNEIAGIEKEVVTTGVLKAEIVKEKVALDMLSLSHSEFVREMATAGTSAAVFTRELQAQGAASTRLLAQMSLLNPEIRAMQVAEQGAVGVIGVVNRELALQAELTTLMEVGQSKYVASIRAETVALARLAVIKGTINMERYNEIAGIKTTTVELKKEKVAIDQITTASARASAASANMNGAMRGAAGATGTLWLSYGSILPLLAAFATVAASIKGYKEALNFEYAVGYMNALGKATGDTTASIGQLRAGLLSIKDVAHGPNDLAVSLKALMKAGFSAGESMKELQTLSRLATVAEEDLATTTTAVISQFRAWSVESVGAARGVKTMSEAANILAAAALTTTLDVGELAKMMKYTPVLASQSQVSFVELAAALGTMSNMGVRGTTAATSLRTAILQLQSPTSKTRSLLKDMGLEVELFTKSGEIKNMSGMFDALAVSLKGVASRERLTLLKSMFSIRAGSAGAIMISQFNKAIQEGTFSFQAQVDVLKKVQLEGRFINDIYKDLAKTTSTLWDETKASWQKAAVETLDTAAVKDFVQGLKDFADDGSLTVLATSLKVVVDVAAEMGSMVAAPFVNLISSFSALNESVYTIRTHLFGATEGFLAAQHAGALYAKSITGIVKYTQQEKEAVSRLVAVYGTLEIAAKAEGFDSKISAVSQELAILKSQEQTLLAGYASAKNDDQAKIYADRLDALEQLTAELKRLRIEKQRMLDDPEAWQAEQDEINKAKKAVDGEVESMKTAINLQKDRRALKLSILKLERDDQLDSDKFSLQLFEQQNKDRLISQENYRAKKKAINDRILQDDLDILNAELALATAKSKEATEYAGTQQATPGADKAAIAAELKMKKAEAAVKQKRKEQATSDRLFVMETNSIKLAKERQYRDTSLQLRKTQIDREKELTLTGISQEQQLLDANKSAKLINEVDYLGQKRELQKEALDAEKKALEDQLSVMKTQRENALKLKGVKETDTEIRNMDDAIVAVGESIEAVKKDRDVLGSLISAEDVGRARAFKDELKEIRKATARKSEDAAFGLGISEYGSDEQSYLKEQRGNKLELADRTTDIFESGGLTEESFGKVSELDKAYQEEDEALTTSYLEKTRASLEKENRDPWEEFQVQLDATQEYYDRHYEMMMANTTLEGEAKTALEMELAENRDEQLRAIESARMSYTIDTAATTFSGLASLAKQLKGEQSKEYKAMFAASQAFQIAQAIMKTYDSATGAYSAMSGIPYVGPVLGAAAAAAAIGAGMANVAQIRSQSYAGAFDDGGTIPAGSFGIVGEIGPEIVTGPANVTSRRDTAAMMSKEAAPAPAPNIRIVNAFDSAVVGDYIGSDAGERAVLNVVKNNPDAVKSLLG